MIVLTAKLRPKLNIINCLLMITCTTVCIITLEKDHLSGSL